MTKTADRTQMGMIVTVISTPAQTDVGARAQNASALANDADRIDAARLTAERLCDWLMIWGTWIVYVDSVGAVVSELA